MSGRIASTDHIRDVDALAVDGIERRAVRALRREGGTARRGVIIHALSNVKSDDLSRALATLQRRGVIDVRIVESGTKPAEEWFFVKGETS